MTAPLMLPAAELRLRDVVQAFDGPYGTAAVCKVTADSITLQRPYGVTSDFSMAGGSDGASQVIHTTGLETWSLWRSSRELYRVWRREETK